MQTLPYGHLLTVSQCFEERLRIEADCDMLGKSVDDYEVRNTRNVFNDAELGYAAMEAVEKQWEIADQHETSLYEVDYDVHHYETPDIPQW